MRKTTHSSSTFSGTNTPCHVLQWAVEAPISNLRGWHRDYPNPQPHAMSSAPSADADAYADAEPDNPKCSRVLPGAILVKLMSRGEKGVSRVRGENSTTYTLRDRSYTLYIGDNLTNIGQPWLSEQGNFSGLDVFRKRWLWIVKYE